MVSAPPAGSARRYHTDGTLPSEANAVFVFGSNELGRHGKGAALIAAKRFGARRGQGFGLVGRSYAIPTKTSATMTAPLTVLPLEAISMRVLLFLEHARQHPDVPFFVVRIGCDLAGYRNEQIAPLFRDAPPNCNLPEDWRPWIEGTPPPARDPWAL